MILYNDHLKAALGYAIRYLKEEEAKIGPDYCSCQRQVFEETLEKMLNGEYVEIRRR